MAQRYSFSLKNVKVYSLIKVKTTFFAPFLHYNVISTFSFP